MNIFVTGANGFLGSHLIRELIQMDETIYGLVRPGSSTDLIKDLPMQLLEGDVRRPLEFNHLPPMDAVFHLAATMGTRSKQLTQLNAVNVSGTRNVIEFVRSNQAKRLIHVSSCVALGALNSPCDIISESVGDRFRQTHLLNFESKRQGQELVLNAVRSQGLDAVIVNPSLIFGAGDVRKEIRQGNLKIAQGKVPVALPGGVNVVGVNDVVQGMIAAWKNGRSGECYILSGENIYTRELFAWIAEAAGQPKPKSTIPRWLLRGLAWLNDTCGIDSEINKESIESLLLYHWCDSSKAKQELGYNPKSAREAVNSSVAWMKENGLL